MMLAPESPHDTIGIVLADGCDMFRRGLAGLLAQEPDLELLAQAADAEAAWHAIRSFKPDVVIFGCTVDVLSGGDIAKRIDAAALGTRCIMLAMHGDPAMASQALGAGVVGYLLKETRFEELLIALHSIDAGGTFVSPSIAAKLRLLRRNGQFPLALSPREQEVVRLMAAGKRSKEIAHILGIGPQTVYTHRRRLMKKLGLRSAGEVACYAASSGLLG